MRPCRTSSNVASGAREVMVPVLWTGWTLLAYCEQSRIAALGTGNGEVLLAAGAGFRVNT